MAACAAAVQFSLGVVAAVNDRLGPDERLSHDSLIRIDRYDVYYSELSDWFPCSASFSWVCLFV